MVYLDELNRDVIANICLFLGDSELAALALTARVFLNEAERLLYRNLAWSGGRAHAVYRLWPLTNPDHCRGRYVRSLSVRIEGRAIHQVQFALKQCTQLTFLRLCCSSSPPTAGPSCLPATLLSLDISWGFFRPERLFHLLGTTPRLESLTVLDWPLDDTEDWLAPGALPALRSLTGPISIVLALLPARPTITSVSITSDFVGSIVIDTLAMNDIRHLEVMFETCTIERICTACPNLESVHFRDAVTEDLDDWLQGAYPTGWKKLTSLRKLDIDFDLIAHEVIAANSAALLREQVKGIWPLLQPGSIAFHRQLSQTFICAA